jgi:menaquinone-specific isochorismate synthase
VRFATRAGEEVAWRDRVARALAAIGRPARDGTGLDKVVLARMLRGLAGEERPDPLALLARLAASQPRSYCFLVEPEPGVAFVGASPERLYRRTPASVTCEALAGTRARAGSPEADAALGAELRRDPKERHEQRLVTDWIRVRLGRLCEAVTCDDEPSVVETTTLQHLRTTIRGRPREGVTDAALLDLLHPTPAVCGVPLSPARRWIEQSERFDRGLYAGPVGWMSRDASEVAVAIRSALISGREVRLYAGAGLVTGSEAEREWRETEGKMRALRALLERGGADGEGR